MKNFGQSCLIGHAWAIILAKGTHSLSCQFSLLNFPYLSFSDWHTSALRQLEYLSNIPWKSSTTRTASQSLSQTGWTYLKTSSESWTIDRKYKIVPCSSIWGKNWREKKIIHVSNEKYNVPIGKGAKRKETLPEAQRTQGIESITWIVSDWNQFEIILTEKDHSSYGLNTLGPLCLWQCFLP